jgi:hypothetical protein
LALVRSARSTISSSTEQPDRLTDGQPRVAAELGEALGRKVIAYMSQIHADPEIAVELFMLEPHEADQSE